MSHNAKLLSAAVAEHQAGRVDQAEKAYRKLLRVDPVNYDGLRLLGGLYLQGKKWAEAAECLQKAARLNGNDPETLTNCGLALHGCERNDEAIAVYQLALKSKPDYLHALNNLGTLYMETGNLEAAATYLGQVLRMLPDSPVAHFNYGNLLSAQGKIIDAIRRYEHALKLKPDYFDAMANLGMALGRVGQGPQAREWVEKARLCFEKVLQTQPNNPVILNNLGNILRQQDKAAEAENCYRKALELRPDYVEAMINLSTALRDLGRMEEADAFCLSALKLRPDSVNAHINRGVLLQETGHHRDALSHFDAALKTSPDSVDARWNKALSLLSLGDLKNGFILHECGLGVSHMRGDYPSPHRRWNGEPVQGKRLLLWAEQGLGDTLQFVRYAALCKERGAVVVVHCQAPLRGLLWHCPFIDELPEKLSEDIFDVHAPMMSLPFIFGTTLETVPSQLPYLFVGKDKQEKWLTLLPQSDKRKVGLVWAGNPRKDFLSVHLVDRRRSMQLEGFSPLFDLPGVQFYSLQKDAAAAQLAAFAASGKIIDPMGQVDDFEDTAAIINQLDLVISVDTSVVHLAGGLGKPVWVLSRFDACWRWLQNRPDNPWYPQARVFGQPKPGDWDSVIAQIRSELVRKTA